MPNLPGTPLFINISWPGGEITARLEPSATTAALAAALPCQAQANTWGEEVYFGVPIKTQLDPDAVDVVPPGTVCFWVQGSSLALPYGPTPVSVGEECRLVTRVNVLGKIDGDPRQLARIRDGARLTVSRIEPPEDS